MSAPTPQRPWLVADVGGTHARFGLVSAAGGAVHDVRSYKGRDHASLQDAALAYLAELAGPGGTAPQPARAALALATPIDGDTVCLTNSDWCISREEIRHALGAEEVVLLNDFEALALALPRLAAPPGAGGDTGAVRWIGAARADRNLPMAVVGPGTGLGVAGCVPAGAGWIALAAEGGHVTCAAADDFESQLLRVLRLEMAHVSAERVLSGSGLPLLHSAVCIVRGVPRDASLEAEDITRRALDEGDADCRATLDAFCAMLGSFAGNVALTLGARGGVFVAGGVAQRLGARLGRSRFRERFESKGRFRDYLAAIATGVVTAPHPALEGAATRLMTNS